MTFARRNRRSIELVTVLVAAFSLACDDGDGGGSSGTGAGSGAGSGAAGTAPSAMSPEANGGSGGHGDDADAGESDGGFAAQNSGDAPIASVVFDLRAWSEWHAPGEVGVGFHARAVFSGGAEIGHAFWEMPDPPKEIDQCHIAQEAALGDYIQWPNGTQAVDRVAWIDGQRRYPLGDIGGSFHPGLYDLDASALGVQPRYSGVYGFEASGGSLRSPVALGGVRLPERIDAPGLESLDLLQRSSFTLTWTGWGDRFVDMLLDIRENNFSGDRTLVRCRVEDDGEFVIPGAVLERVTMNGFAQISLVRDAPLVRSSGGIDVLTVAAAHTIYQVAFGDVCDRPELMAACKRWATKWLALEKACGIVEPDSMESLCRSYLAKACGGCPEEFDCLVTSASCHNGIVSGGSCQCP